MPPAAALCRLAALVPRLVDALGLVVLVSLLGNLVGAVVFLRHLGFDLPTLVATASVFGGAKPVSPAVSWTLVIIGGLVTTWSLVLATWWT